MTEREWLTSQRPVTMGKAVVETSRATDRILRLLPAVFWQWQTQWLEGPRAAELLQNATMTEEWAETGKRPKLALGSFIGFEPFAREVFTRTLYSPSHWRNANGKAATAHCVILLREMFGNPYTLTEKPATANRTKTSTRKRKSEKREGWHFESDWRTETASALARTMYNANDFSAVPILADALQDAGCDNEDILAHCRNASHTHVRGCWVVDLVLGQV